jgi:methyl halide transferase
MPNEWEQRYQTQSTPWEKGTAHPALLEFLQKVPMRGRVFVPGCGYGHDVRAIAAGADEVVGLDIAPSAIAAAQSFPEVGGERYVEGNLFELSRAWNGSFDWVFEHTCFCAIDPSRRPDYVAAIERLLVPGGRLFAIFYMNPDMDPGEAGPPFGTTEEELDRAFGEGFIVEASWVPERTFPGRDGRELCRLMRRTA